VRLGGKPAISGSFAGALHRVFMDLRAILNLHSAKPVLAECERGETFVLNHYENALEEGLPDGVKQVVEKQFVEILMTRNKLQELEKPTKKTEKKEYNPLSFE
jgi:uncharacterized protein (TIGR02284 family)